MSLQAQKSSLFVIINDSSNADASKWVFTIKISNNKLKKYQAQDTAYIREYLEVPIYNSVTPYLFKHEDGKYKQYRSTNQSGDIVAQVDSCLPKCCNCIVLKKGEFLQINLDLLKPFKFEKGKYRLQISIIPPFVDCTDCKFLHEIHSNFIYFEVI